MNRRSGGLGRGLGSLIPADVVADDGASLREIALGQIDTNPFQPRSEFDEGTLLSLSESIRELGVLQPILVRPTPGGRFELIAGERRLRAARKAGLATIPALVREVDDNLSLEQALVENLHRVDLNPLEEAAAYQQLIEDFGMSQDQVAARVGKSRPTITNTLRLFQLPPSVQKLLIEHKLTAGHARALLGTPDRGFQEALARRAVSAHLTVREVEAAIKERNELESRLADEDIVEDEAARADGDSASPAARRDNPPLPPAGLLELEELLGRYLDTTVQVALGAKRGRITVDFADLEDLERLFKLMVHPDR